MPQYEIEQYEIHVQKYRVEARDEARAIKRLYDGEAEVVDNGLEYVEVADDRGMPIESCPDLADALRLLGEDAEEIIPSIRCISEV
ncbi:MAG: hypothetical protein K8T91_18870 [Planctomycetes bacterium]|nr:hypothetical protein [Planctomycetota bacterium]